METNEEKLFWEPHCGENNTEDDIFITEEIEIEEMAIDGICGVY